MALCDMDLLTMSSNSEKSLVATMTALRSLFVVAAVVVSVCIVGGCKQVFADTTACVGGPCGPAHQQVTAHTHTQAPHVMHSVDVPALVTTLLLFGHPVWTQVYQSASVPHHG